MYLNVFFIITICLSDKAYVKEEYKDNTAVLFQLKNIGQIIPKLFELSDITV